MKYRREIDGLRAVAVLPVILFHAGFNVFSGGYVGVDVFFVISGYLITCIIIAELDQGTFSIARFYERRARRILPALFVVILACLPFAYMWMLPAQLEEFAESIVAVCLFLSNWLFWSQVDYFDTASELKPLLHTWSLAVEEQYYLLFPLWLIGLWRFGRRFVFGSIIAVAVLSLLLSEWGWRNEPGINFFFTFSRFWELLAGSICAFLTVGKETRSNNLLGLVGIVMILFAVFAYDVNTPFPSVYALVPVVGTALVILFASTGTWVANLLSMKGFVGIGLVSYSAYLWHQPVFAFARIRSLTEPSLFLMSVLAVATFVLAGMTWKWIEQPFRKGNPPLLQQRKSVFLVAGVVMMSFITIGLMAYKGEGFEWRLSDQAREIARAGNDRPSRRCINRNNDNVPNHPVATCLELDQDRHPEVMLVGDSHGNALGSELGALLQQNDIGFYQTYHSGCVPIRGLRTVTPSGWSNCALFNDAAYDYAMRAGIETVVLIGRFDYYYHGTRYDNTEGGIEHGAFSIMEAIGHSSVALNDPDRRSRILDAYGQEIRKLAETFNVVLVFPAPGAGWDVPDQATRLIHFYGRAPDLTTPFAAYQDRTREVNALFNKLDDELSNVFGVRIYEEMCSAQTGRCVNVDADGVYYYDAHHLSNAGARRVSPPILKAIEAAVSYTPSAQD